MTYVKCFYIYIVDSPRLIEAQVCGPFQIYGWIRWGLQRNKPLLRKYEFPKYKLKDLDLLENLNPPRERGHAVWPLPLPSHY